jgi:transcriptional regulator of acetoin/glycerol metabolism
VIERAVMLCQTNTIDLVDLPIERLGRTLPPDVDGVGGHLRGNASLRPFGSDLTAYGPSHSGGHAWSSSSPGAYSYLPAPNQGDSRREPEPRGGAPSEERERIIRALERCAGNQTHAARELGMSRRTLISRIERYDLPRPRKRARP